MCRAVGPEEQDWKTTGLVCDGQFSFVTIYEVGKLEPLVPD